jgi:hypothetical protein
MRILVFFLMATAVIVCSKPSYNGITPGCGGGSCHPSQNGILTLSPQGNGNVTVTLSGYSGHVAGELVKESNNLVVDFEDSTTSNPFTLTAPQSGYYYVNAGYLGPYERKFVTINIVPVEPISMGIIRSLFK